MYKLKNSLIARHRRWMALSALLIAVAMLSVGTKLMKAQETEPPLAQGLVFKFGLVSITRDQAVRLNALKIPSPKDVTVNVKIRYVRRHGAGGAVQIGLGEEKTFLQSKDQYDIAQTDFRPDRPDRFFPDFLNRSSVEFFATVTITGGDPVDRARVIPTLEVIDIDTGKTAILYPCPPPPQPCGASGEPCNDTNDVNQ